MRQSWRVYHPIIGNFRWMTWNLLLAAIPAILALVLFRSGARRGPAWWLGLAALVAFLPNSAYVLTDVVHLPAELRAARPHRLELLAIVVQFGALFTLGFGAYALTMSLLDRWLRSIGWTRRGVLVVSIAAHLVCAVGVFLGRSWRFNSWDLLRRPGDVLSVVAGGLANPHARTIAIVGFVWMVFAVGTAITRSVATVGLRLTTDGRSGRGRLHGGEPHPASSP